MTSPTPEMKELSTDWQERFRKQFTKLTSKCSFVSHNLNIPDLENFISQEIDASYKRGRDEMSKEILGCMAIDNDVIPDRVYVMSQKQYDRIKKIKKGVK